MLSHCFWGPASYRIDPAASFSHIPCPTQPLLTLHSWTHWETHSEYMRPSVMVSSQHYDTSSAKQCYYQHHVLIIINHLHFHISCNKLSTTMGICCMQYNKSWRMDMHVCKGKQFEHTQTGILVLKETKIWAPLTNGRATNGIPSHCFWGPSYPTQTHYHYIHNLTEIHKFNHTLDYATISCSKLPASCHKFCKKMHLHQHSPTIIKHTHPTVDTTKYQHTEGTACMQSNTIYYGICLSRKKVIPAHTKLASGTDLFYLPGGQNVPYSTYTGG